MESAASGVLRWSFGGRETWRWKTCLKFTYMTKERRAFEVSSTEILCNVIWNYPYIVFFREESYQI